MAVWEHLGVVGELVSSTYQSWLSNIRIKEDWRTIGDNDQRHSQIEYWHILKRHLDSEADHDTYSYPMYSASIANTLRCCLNFCSAEKKLVAQDRYKFFTSGAPKLHSFFIYLMPQKKLVRFQYWLIKFMFRFHFCLFSIIQQKLSFEHAYKFPFEILGQR